MLCDKLPKTYHLKQRMFVVSQFLDMAEPDPLQGYKWEPQVCVLTQAPLPSSRGCLLAGFAVLQGQNSRQLFLQSQQWRETPLQVH